MAIESSKRAVISFADFETKPPQIPLRPQRTFPSPKKKLPKISKLALIKILNFAIVFFILSFLFLYKNIIKQEINYQIKKTTYSVPAPKKRLTSQNITPFLNYRFSQDKKPFAIHIPKINASSKITPNVNPKNPSSYTPVLKKSVAHAKGSVFPGMDGKIHLFAHSSIPSLKVIDYNAVFFLLRKLEKFDQIYIYYYGKKFLYQVTDKKIVANNQTSFINQKSNTEQLILQTCYPPGTQLETLLIFAKPVFVQYQ